MNCNMKKSPYILKGLWRLVLAVILVAIALFSFADANDRARIKPFAPPSNFNASEEVDIPHIAAQHFDVFGEIFIIIPDENRIVVYDVSFNLAPGVRTAGFREGMYVGMKLNNEKEVVSIERLDKNNFK